MSGNRSDSKQKKAFMLFLKTVRGVDKESISDKNTDGVDVVARINGIKKYFELKTTSKPDDELEKKAYFGAASINEWKCAIDHPKDFYFVYIKGEEGAYEYLMVTARDVFSYSTVPPFSIDINIKLGNYWKNFKKLSNVEDVTILENTITRLKKKKRNPNQTSFGVSRKIIKRLYKYYVRQKAMFLKNISKKSPK